MNLGLGCKNYQQPVDFFTYCVGPTDETVPVHPDISLPLTPRSVQCRIKNELFKMPLPPSFEVLEELGRQFIKGITPEDEDRDEDSPSVLLCTLARRTLL